MSAMASSRESSPASAAGTSSPAQLTPNSKVKALLAAFDNDSDDESVSGSARTRLLSTIAKANTASIETTSVSRAITSDIPHGTVQEDTEDDEEDEIVRPQGRMASKMLAGNKPEEDEPAQDDARERVRKMLMTKTKSPEPAADTEDRDENDEEDAPVVVRKRKVRVPRRESPKSSPVKGPASPGLFVSPRPDKSASPSGDTSDSDDIPTSVKDNRFLALVAKKREERLAKEAELEREKAQKAAEHEKYSALLQKDDQLNDSDDNVERRLTQQSRPSRKASKKALEEMHRETQRLSRNQQLAHNAITKKKVTKASLFAKFNFRPAGQVEEVSDPVRPTSSSSAAPHSDVEMKETPPTSPVSPAEDGTKFEAPAGLPGIQQQEDEDGSLPTFEEMITQLPSSPPPRLDKGKGKAIEEAISEPPKVFKKPVFKQRPIRVRPPKIADRTVSPMDDSDSDLEIVSETPVLRKKLESIFDRVPAKMEKESRPIHVLRMFAMKSPGKQNAGRNKKPSMTATELQVSLQQRARQQAAREKEERLEALRAKGVHVQTTEEREREMADVDDILARARREDEELMKREKAAAKKERKENGEVDPLGDSSDDEDYEEGKEGEQEELSVSGSEDEMEEVASGEEENSSEEEDEEEDESMALDTGSAPSNPMFDNEADESENEESEADLSINEENAEDGDVDEDDEERDHEWPIKQKNRRSRNAHVISDDEDEDEENVDQPTPQQPQTASPAQLHSESPMVPNSVLRSATKTFIPGLTVAGPAGLGLTQIFAGTMDESQMDPFEASPSAQNTGPDALAFLRQVSAPELPPFIPTLAEDTQDINMDASQLSHVPESQPNDSETQGIELNFTQSQIHGFDTLVQDTQMSQFPEATQDVGFQHMTPIRGRFVDAPPSTVGTVVLDPKAIPETTEETPIVKKKGKLRRRAQVASFSDGEDAINQTELNVEEDEFDITSNAFDVMRKASKKKIVVDEFDKKQSKAKEMVNEQAEESEDEYAGLGGASDDEDGEEDDYVKGIIDDEGGKDVDERKIAAFYA
jgi:mediator of replication checkpoint protein 1